MMVPGDLTIVYPGSSPYPALGHAWEPKQGHRYLSLQTARNGLVMLTGFTMSNLGSGIYNPLKLGQSSNLPCASYSL